MTELTKWPRLLVVGEPVTPEQANEILLRTDSWNMLTNDRHWVRMVSNLIGVAVDEHDRPDWRAVKDFAKSIRVLDLGYLDNSRIMCSWIGGPKGWCDWGGTIGCANYNIGKWPSVEDVTGDWQTIAATFPFLSLKAQCVPDEGEDDRPAVEWSVHEGQVDLNESPTAMLRAPEDADFTAMLRHHGERGVDFFRLRDALEQVRAGAAE